MLARWTSPIANLADLPAQVPNPIRLWWPAERLAVQRRGRRRAGFSMLHQCPGGVPVRCNGLFDNGTLPQRFADPCQRIAGGSKTIASCEQTVVVFEPESLLLRSFRPGFRRLPPLHSSRDQISPRANRPRQKYPACRTPCRSAARAPHERFVDVTPISLRRLRPLQRLVRRRTLVLVNLRDSSLSPPLPAPSFADLPRLRPYALVAAASGTIDDAHSHDDQR